MALITSIVSYWKLDEASGNPADSVSSNTLTNNGTCTFASALINNGVSATSNGQYLSNASVLGITSSSDFSISFWIKRASEDTNDHDLFGIFQNGNPTGFYHRGLYEYNAGTRRLRFFRSGSSTTFLDKTGNIANNAWHHIVYTFKGSTGAMSLYVDNGAAVTGTNTGAGNVGVTTQFNLCDTAASGFAAVLNGSMDEVGFWSRELTSGEVSSLYNGGAGLAYPFASTATYSTALMMGI